jgi:hypothetical protein
MRTDFHSEIGHWHQEFCAHQTPDARLSLVASPSKDNIQSGTGGLHAPVHISATLSRSSADLRLMLKTEYACVHCTGPTHYTKGKYSARNLAVCERTI